MSRLVSLISIAAVLFAFACSDDTTTTQMDSAVANDAAVADTGSTAGDAAAACDFKAMAAEAMSKGKKINNGVKLTKITPIADIKADTAGYTGKVVRIEGIVIEICQSQGCYLTLKGAKGNKLNLKVTDGKVDFRKFAKLGNYATGEGTFDPSGSHGAMVFIDKYGAMIGNMVCTK